MSTNFNWHTDEDDRWDEIETTAPAPKKPRRWPRQILPLLLAAVAIAAVVWQLTRRVDETTTAVSTDVLASHEIVIRAAQHDDIELFVSVLSGRESGWTEAQKQLLRGGGLIDYPQFGLTWLGPDGTAAPADVTMAPDLMAATVATEQLYAVAIGNGLTETIRLRREDVYRQGSSRWLLAPPLPDYWGSERTIDTGRVRLTYPLRDEAFAGDFALDLDEKIAELCRLFPELNCDSAGTVQIRFDPSPATLYSSSIAEVAWQPGADLQLPTPSLVGSPVDDDAYRALFRGYTAAILQQVIGAWVGYDCCTQGLLLQALVDFQLSQLALRPWPLTPADFERMLLGGEDLLVDTRIWDATVDPARQNELWRYAYGLVAMSQSASVRPSLVQMERELGLPGGYLTWFNRFVTLTSFERNFERSWRQFIYANSLSVNRPQPVAWPAQEVYATCSSRRQPTISSLISFNLATGLQQTLYTFEFEQRLFGLPNDDGVIIEGDFLEGVRGGHLTIFRNGEPHLWFSRAPESAAPMYSGFHDNTGRRLVVYHASTDGGGANNYSLLNLDTCSEANCPLQPLAGIPVWSPDGSATLLHETTGNLLLGDANGQVVGQFNIDDDRPTWIDNRTFAYVHDGRLYAGGVNLQPTYSLLSEENLAEMAAALGLDAADGLVIRDVIRHPDNADRLILAAADFEHMTGGVFELDIARQAVNLRFTANTFLPGADTFALTTPANTSWLQLWQLRFGPFAATYQHQIGLYALDDGAEPVLELGRAQSQSDWSGDGHWLVVAGGDYLHFIAPAYSYQRVIFLPSDLTCDNAVWVNASQELIEFARPDPS